MSTKRFLVFAGDDYYPLGGMNDFMGAFATKVEAVEAGAKEEWWHVYDTVMRIVIADSDEIKE